MTKNVLIVASNHGLWAEELQGPWDALEQAGNKLTLATYLGKKPRRPRGRRRCCR